MTEEIVEIAPEPVRFSGLRAALNGVGFCAGVFTVVVCLFMAAMYVQLRAADPLNNEELVALRDQYAQDVQVDTYRAAVRELDLSVRKKFFRNVWQINKGGLLALGGAIVMFIAFGAAYGLRLAIPEIPTDDCSGMFWMGVIRSRGWLAGAGVIVVAVAVVLSLTTPTELSEDLLHAPAPDAPEPAAAQDPVTGAASEPEPAPAVQQPVAPAFPSRDEMMANAPSFRGTDGNGLTQGKATVTEWDEESGKNILWKAKVPLTGLASPVVWKDRVFLAGATREERHVYCFSVKDGTLLWTGSYQSSPDASTEYDVYDSPEALMYACATPATDGMRVYAIFANGELAAFDAAEGKALWSVVVGDTADNAYGLSGSLLAYEGDVIVQFDGDSYALVRYNGVTGKQVWRVERDDSTWASPALVQTPSGKKVILTNGDPETAAWDPATGKKLWSAELVGGDIAPSPVYADGRVFVNFSGCGIYAVDADTGKSLWATEELEEGTFSDTQSMVSDGARVYQFYDGVLSVLNAKDGSIVYEQVTDWSASYGSPYIVNDKLYLVCGSTTAVLATGDEYNHVGTGELKEYSDVSPAVAGGKIFIRTEESLYCVGEK